MATRTVPLIVCSFTTTNRLVLCARHSQTRQYANQRTIDWTAPRDFLVRSKTGSITPRGCIIPAIESQLGRAFGSAGALILAPTRELAIQIAMDAQRLTTHQKGFEVQLLAAGGDKAQQAKDWMGSTRDLLVATPGRLRDLLTNEPELRQSLKSCPMLILDDADMLLSMGFRDDIDAIVSFLPRPPFRRTVLISTTMSRAVRQLASWILSPDYTFIDAASHEPMAHHHIQMFQTLCSAASEQLPTLLKLLAHDQLTNGPGSKAIIFCPTSEMADLLSMLLRSIAPEVLPNDNTEIVKMHLKMKQSDKNKFRELFYTAGQSRSGRPSVLVTSDVSAGGMNYPGLTRMIQVGIPNRATVYTHRMEKLCQNGNVFVTGRGKENIRPSVRADLLLLPWEAGYMNWQLTDLPIKSLPISVLDGQLAALSAQSLTLTTEFLRSALAEIQRRVDPADVRNTAASLLAYYLPLTPPLRLQPHAVLAGVSSWASECFHVSIPTITRFPKRFTDAYEQATQSEKTKGLFVDGLRLARTTPLGKAKSGNRSVWEGAHVRRKKPKRWC